MFAMGVVALAALTAWIYLILGRGGFWLVRQQELPEIEASARSIAVVVPARNEAQTVGEAVASLLNQKLPGRLEVFLVDDHSTDGTVEAAGTDERLHVITAEPLPDGWTGKLWAVSQGLDAALATNPDYVLLTDADIVHSPLSVSALVARAEVRGLDLTSCMVELRSETLAERALIPAFVFFFLMLYPPNWISNPKARTAGAAGGCILIRPRALARIGGIAAIRGELIDDCALASAVKPGGGVWLGVTRNARSIREYSTFGEIHRMIARTAFVQLNRSALLLAGTIVAIAIVYLAPPLLIFAPSHWAAMAGVAAWALMSLSYLPTLRLYRRSWLWAPLLPLVAAFYMVATIDSARRYWTGRGGEWKGRVQNARPSDAQRSSL